MFTAIANFFIGVYQGVAATPQAIIDHPLPAFGLAAVLGALLGGIGYVLTRDN